ncbi:hypothetical protein DSECCO2_486320 [anaerobic digester metagenome]
MKQLLFIFIAFTYLSGVAQQEKPCKDISFEAPQKTTLEIDNGYRADSCEYHCLCEPQSVDGEKHYYYYDQLGRDTSTWNFYQDTIIDPWYLDSKNTWEYTSFSAVLNEKGYWYDTLGVWQYSSLLQNTYNTSQEMIHHESYLFYYSPLPYSIGDFTYGSNGISQSVYYVAYPSYPAKLMSKTIYYYNLLGNMSYCDHYSYDTLTSAWDLASSKFYTYDSLENLIQCSYFDYVNGVPECYSKDLFEYDGFGRLLRDMELYKYSFSTTFDTTRVHEYYYNSFNKPDSVLRSDCSTATHKWDMLEKYYYDSLGNQIRWEYYLHWQNDSVWQLFGWEDCYYSQHLVTHDIPEPSNETIFSVFPNPADEKLNIEFTDYNVSSVSIIDIRGAAIKSWILQGKNTFSGDISDVPDGLYFIRCSANDGSNSTKTIVVQH